MKQTTFLLLAFLVFSMSKLALAQTNNIEPVGVGETMANFKLMSYQGDEINLENYRGKNVLLAFPRGKVLPNMWCPLCYYQYAELAEIDKAKDIRKKYNLEILYVLPYPKDSIDEWRKNVNGGLSTIENWKNPPGLDTLPDGYKRWAKYVREFYPKTFVYENGKMPLPIPILIDEDKTLSNGLMLSTKEWGGTKADQNMPTVFLLDKEGVVRFKYHSQYTNDRPTIEYLLKFIDKMM